MEGPGPGYPLTTPAPLPTSGFSHTVLVPGMCPLPCLGCLLSPGSSSQLPLQSTEPTHTLSEWRPACQSAACPSPGPILCGTWCKSIFNRAPCWKIAKNFKADKFQLRDVLHKTWPISPKLWMEIIHVWEMVTAKRHLGVLTTMCHVVS